MNKKQILEQVAINKKIVILDDLTAEDVAGFAADYIAKISLEKLQTEDQAMRFINKVKTMREMQKEYFRTRAEGYLQESKRLEKEIDQAIKIITQPQLFKP